MAIVRSLIDRTLQNAVTSPKLLKSISAQVEADLSASKVILSEIDRVATTKSRSDCQVFVNNEWLSFDLLLNQAFMAEIVRAQSIGSKVYIVYSQTAKGREISLVSVAKPES